MSDAMYEVISLVAHGLEGIETEWDTAKLEKKLKEYFNKAGKNMKFAGKKLQAAIDEYCDNAMSSICSGLGERTWLHTQEGDMVLILDAGIKDLFPGSLFKNVSQDDFEAMVLASYDRAFDEQRFWPILSEAVASNVNGPKTKKKVWNAVDAARKEAVAAGLTDPSEFVAHWVARSVALLAAASSQSGLSSSVEADKMTTLFQTLLEAEGLPTFVVGEEGAGAPTQVVEEAVGAAYLEHEPPEAELGELAAEDGEPPAKKKKGVYSAFG